MGYIILSIILDVNNSCVLMTMIY